MSATRNLGLIVVAVVGCRAERSRLAADVKQYCDASANNLERRAKEYRGRRAIDDTQLSAAQKSAADIEHGILDQAARGEVELAHVETFSFCVRIRELDETKKAEFTDQFSSLAQRFEQSADLDALAESLEGMAKLAREVVSSPLRR
ncbi:MAG: hypothetical protein ABI678_15330 [Kofleriaceae bacterium]